MWSPASVNVQGTSRTHWAGVPPSIYTNTYIKTVKNGYFSQSSNLIINKSIYTNMKQLCLHLENKIKNS